MKNRFRDYDPDQILMLPPSLQDWLPKDHLVHFIRTAVDQLDLNAIYASYEDARGRPPYSPRMMVAVWLYAYCLGVRSSRRVERALIEDVGFRVLSGNQQPDYWTLNAFRTRHIQALGNLFVQTVLLAQKAGLVELKQVAADGTKLKANASKHSAMSYDRMEKEEKRLREEIERYFKEADEIDEEENRRFGKRRGDELPEHLDTHEKRLKAIQKAKKELEEEAKERVRAEQEQRRKEADKAGRPYQPKKDPEDAKPDPKAQRNFTDPESRIMRSSEKAFIQGYNAQAAVDADSQIIVGADLTHQAADVNHLPDLIEQVIRNTNDVPNEISADAGYFSESNLAKLEELGIEAYIPPDRIKHSEWKKQKPPRGRIPKNLSPADRMRRKLRTVAGRRRYKLRQCSIEPTFGQIKEGRGLRQFLHRGLEKVRAMWRFDCAAHNILKVFRSGFAFAMIG
jgi:transposase